MEAEKSIEVHEIENDLNSENTNIFKNSCDFCWDIYSNIINCNNTCSLKCNESIKKYNDEICQKHVVITNVSDSPISIIWKTCMTIYKQNFSFQDLYNKTSKNLIESDNKILRENYINNSFIDHLFKGFFISKRDVSSDIFIFKFKNDNKNYFNLNYQMLKLKDCFNDDNGNHIIVLGDEIIVNNKLELDIFHIHTDKFKLQNYLIIEKLLGSEIAELYLGYAKEKDFIYNLFYIFIKIKKIFDIKIAKFIFYFPYQLFLTIKNKYISFFYSCLICIFIMLPIIFYYKNNNDFSNEKIKKDDLHSNVLKILYILKLYRYFLQIFSIYEIRELFLSNDNDIKVKYTLFILKALNLSIILNFLLYKYNANDLKIFIKTFISIYITIINKDVIFVFIQLILMLNIIISIYRKNGLVLYEKK